MFADLFKKLFPGKKLEIKDARTKTRHEVMVECLDHCEASLGKRFNVRSAQAVEFETIVPNILEMIKALRRINAVLEKQQSLPPSATLFDFKKITLADFFIDEDTGTYISQESYRTFHTFAREFAELTKEGQSAEWGVHEYNYRALSKVFRGIIQICQAIDQAHNL